MIGSTHNHSTGSDGKLTPEEVIQKAIALDWDYVYFTDHYFKPAGYIVKPKYAHYFNKDYVKKVKELRKKYKGKIEIYFGAEFDWVERFYDWLKEEAKKGNFDYIIGSIHKLIFNEEYLEMEPGKEIWIKNLKKTKGIKGFVKEYYKQIRNIAKSGIFDSIGHLDYIKLYNKNNEFFSEDDDWYKQEISKTLDTIKKYNIVLEINAAGIRKCGEQFPSTWILKEAKKLNIPIILGIDAHKQEHYTNELLNNAIKETKKAGYKEHVRFVKRKRIIEKL